MYVLTAKGFRHEEKFILLHDKGKYTAISLGGYKSQAEGRTLKDIISEVEAIEEVKAEKLSLVTLEALNMDEVFEGLI